jgi:hypothetical protein
MEKVLIFLETLPDVELILFEIAAQSSVHFIEEK